MKTPLILALLAAGSARAATMPTTLVCSKLTYTVECQTNLPMPCPVPPPVYPMPFAEAPLNASSDGRYQAGRASISRLVDVEGTKFQLFAEGSFSANADGSGYEPAVKIELTETASGWTSLARSARGETRQELLVKRSRKLDRFGRIATATGHFVCELR